MDFDFYKFRLEGIKPCPFCGEAPDFYGHGWITIKCCNCNIEMENKNGSRDSEGDCSRLKEHWNRRHTTLTPAKGEPMPQTREYWESRALRDQELILEMKAENSRLRSRVNNLEQKIGGLNGRR